MRFIMKKTALLLLAFALFAFTACTAAEPSPFPYGDGTNPYKNLTVEDVESIRVEVPTAASYTYADFDGEATAEMVEALRAVTLNGTPDETVYGQNWKLVIRFAEGGKSELFVGAMLTVDGTDYRWDSAETLESLCQKAFS